MQYAFFDLNGRVAEAHNDDTVGTLPDGAFELDADQWRRRFDLRLAGGQLIDDPLRPVLPPIEALQARASALLSVWEQRERDAGIDHAGQHWLTTADALQDLRDMLLAGAVPGGVWVTAARQAVPMTLAELQMLWQAITARVALVRQQRLAMEREVAEMDAEQLAAFSPVRDHDQ
ncbi:DUF4376 domain-containing protein [Microvirgula aerodenitrificans]|uniref:DUF4376 domain-containing protein n=1 Tax=Microvirgula aerodenitrificans TaxID=57480 RepID=UPI002F3F7B37